MNQFAHSVFSNFEMFLGQFGMLCKLRWHFCMPDSIGMLFLVVLLSMTFWTLNIQC